MARLEVGKVGFDAEEFADEIFKVRGDGDDQFRGLLVSQRSRIFASPEESVAQRGVAGFQVMGERFVEADKAFAGIEIVKLDAERERQVIGCNTHADSKTDGKA